MQNNFSNTANTRNSVLSLTKYRIKGAHNGGTFSSDICKTGNFPIPGAQHYRGNREGNIEDKEINPKPIQYFLLGVIFYEKLLGRAFAAGQSSFDP